ncbi:MAG: sugar-binding domain-containing protein, partial [Flavobacteriaceae bacterium]
MKKTLLQLILILAFLPLNAQWKPAGNKIKTAWADKIEPDKVLDEYPRPIMQRTDWKNLNGLWDYAIRPKGMSSPSAFDGKILVPFAVESSLSGVMKGVGADQELWYHTDFEIPGDWSGKKIVLHFGAVDWKADVWINAVKVGSH